MTETGKRIKSLLNTDIKPSVLMFIDCLADWYKMAQTIYLQTEILENDLNDQGELLLELRGKLFILREDLKTHLQSEVGVDDQELPPTASSDLNGPSKVLSPKAEGKEFPNFSRRDLKNLFNLSCDTTTLVRENEDLISQLISVINSKGLI